MVAMTLCEDIMKTFNDAIMALIHDRPDLANDLFSKFVNAHLNEDAQDAQDDQLSGDLNSKENEGLTEDNALAKTVNIANDDAFQRFNTALKPYLGNKQTDVTVISNMKTNGQEVMIVNVNSEHYTITFYELNNEYYALYQSSAFEDYYEELKFSNSEEWQTFANTIN